MHEDTSFGHRLAATIVPTSLQTFGSLVLAGFFIAILQSQTILKSLGITQDALNLGGGELHSRFDVILRSSAASQVALMTFWATVGLIAYLVCWGAYNILIEARNEVTLNTAYTNRGHWRGAYGTLALKAASAAGLALVIFMLKYSLSFWASLSARAFSSPSPASIGIGVASVIAFAVHLYLVVLFVQLTFTPWYRAQAFTGA